MSRIKWFQWLFMAGLAASGLAAAPPRQEATPAPATEAPTEAPTDAAATLPFAPPPWISPTPDATGAIVVIVQPGESMWVIAARAGISLPELLALNNLTEQSIINPGDALIVGYATPEAGATPEQTTPTPPPPPTLRPTEPPPEAAVCLTAFDDLNRDGIHDAGEPLRAGVAFTLYNSEAVVANYITDGRSEPKCLGGLAPGEYRVTRSLASGETLTTAGDWTLNLTAGSELRQDFGSVIGPTPAVASAGNEQNPPAQTATPTPPDVAVSSPRAAVDSPGLRIAFVVTLFLGGLLLLGAVLILLLRPARNPLASPTTEKSDDGRRFRNIDDLD